MYDPATDMVSTDDLELPAELSSALTLAASNPATLRALLLSLGDQLRATKGSREQALVITKLDEARGWVDEHIRLAS